MRRKLFTPAAAVSAVLCAGVCVLWVRGYRVADDVAWTRSSVYGASYYRWYLTVASGRGGLGIMLDAEVYDRGSITDREAARPRDRWERVTPRGAGRPPAYPRPWSNSPCGPQPA